MKTKERSAGATRVAAEPAPAIEPRTAPGRDEAAQRSVSAEPGTIVRLAARMLTADVYRVPRGAGPGPIDLRLDANEGPLAPPQVVEEARVELAQRAWRYPDARELERELAQRSGVDPGCVLVTAGIDDALQRTCLVAVEPGSRVVLTEPTFEMIGRYARLAGGRIRAVEWWSGAYPLEQVLARIDDATSLVAFVSPNNPTGGAARAGDLERVARSCPRTLVAADLAYAEFAEKGAACAALRLPNVLALRTVSKAWGLAGCRVGYAIGSAAVIGRLRAAGNPYAVSGPSLALALAAVRDGGGYVERHVRRVRRERELLARLLAGLGAVPLESQANFVAARFADALAVWRGLAARGIAVRAFPGRGKLADYLRITCPGGARPFARLCAALRAVLPGGCDGERP